MKLFEPIKIRNMELKNRIVMAPMQVGIGYRGKRATAYYAERARGGAGAIMVAGTMADVYCSKEAWGGAKNYAAFIEGVHNLTKSVHEAGAKIGAQLIYFNRYPGTLDPFQRESELVAPSARTETNRRRFFLNPDEDTMRELTRSEIESIISIFGRAAASVKEAGFDFAELHCAHQYLLCQFLSPFHNHRNDEYGGDLKRRMRISIDCIKEMRKAVGADYPLFCRIGAEEKRQPGGITIEDTVKFAQELEKAEVDVIHVSTGDGAPAQFPSYEYPMGTFLHVAEAVRRKVNIPVMTVARIHSPELAETIISEGKADLVAIGRALLADPFWPEKVKIGRLNEIAPCISCARCSEPAYEGAQLCCTVNPSAGREEGSKLKPAEKPKKVVVIGGGPAGMAAAATAALRGHKVTLFEKSDKLGGQLSLVEAVPYKKEVISNLTNYLIKQVERWGVEVIIGTEATVQVAELQKPDEIIIATGTKPYVPDIRGIKESNVVTAEEILAGEKEAGLRVAIIGGGLIGCDTAEFLVDIGKKVTIIEMLPRIAANMVPMLRKPLMERLASKYVTVFTGAQLEEISNNLLVFLDRDEIRRIIEVDTIVIATGAQADTKLAKELENKGLKVRLIGDCSSPRNIRDAISDGVQVGSIV